MQETAPARGYACLVSQSHVVELHELPEAVAPVFMSDARKSVQGVSNCHRGGKVELRNSRKLDTALAYALLPAIPR
jgi:hypothetical protein